MKSTVVKFGTYSSVILIILFSIQFIFEDGMGYSTSEVFGYISIIVALSFVYFGIRNYRDGVNNGQVSFLKALKIGVLITLITSLTFGLINVVYTEFINPDFANDYYQQSIETYRQSLPEPAFQTKLAELESQKEMFSNPIMSFLLMFATVFFLGFVISLISGLLLRRKS